MQHPHLKTLVDTTCATDDDTALTRLQEDCVHATMHYKLYLLLILHFLAGSACCGGGLLELGKLSLDCGQFSLQLLIASSSCHMLLQMSLTYD